MGWFVIVWLIVGILIVCGVSVFVGYEAADNHYLDGDHAISIIGGSAVAAIAWPLLLGVAVAAGPFVGLYFLGVYLRNKKTSKHEATSQIHDAPGSPKQN